MLACPNGSWRATERRSPDSSFHCVCVRVGFASAFVPGRQVSVQCAQTASLIIEGGSPTLPRLSGISGRPRTCCYLPRHPPATSHCGHSGPRAVGGEKAMRFPLARRRVLNFAFEAILSGCYVYLPFSRLYAKQDHKKMMQGGVRRVKLLRSRWKLGPNTSAINCMRCAQ